MKLISENPFRIIGLAANIKERELQRRKTELYALLNIGKYIESNFDFNIFEKVEKKRNSVDTAFASIENTDQKLIHALFWFVSFGNSDELAFDFLLAGETQKSFEIWKSLSESNSSSDRKLSAINNLGTLLLFSAFKKGEFNISIFQEAITLKRTLLESEYLALLKIVIFHFWDKQLVTEIDETIKEHGGFPLVGSQEVG